MKLIHLLVLPFCFVAGGLRAAPDAPATLTPVAKAPFRLIFKAYDGDPKIDPIKQFSFQIDTIDRRQPAEFLNMGTLIPNTHFKLLKFEFKTARNATLQEDEDASELTILNTVTKKTAVLPFNKVVDVSAIDAPAQKSK